MIAFCVRRDSHCEERVCNSSVENSFLAFQKCLGRNLPTVVARDSETSIFTVFDVFLERLGLSLMTSLLSDLYAWENETATIP